MFKNYLKLAWRVLWRKKFFTFISLFGISFTLASLMLFTSIFQTELSDNPPLGNADDLVYLTTIAMQKQYYDTIPVIDTISTEIGLTFDTTFTTTEAGRSMSNSDLSTEVLENYLSEVPSAKHAAFINIASYDVFVNNSKLNVQAAFTNAEYWSVFDFEFVEGRSFDQSDAEQNNAIMVVTENFAKEYFGASTDVVDKKIKMDGKTYRIIGMVKTPNVSTAAGYSVSRDVFIPYSLLPEGYQEDFYFGGFHAVFQKMKDGTIDQLKHDIKHVATQIPLDHPDNEREYNELILRPASIKEELAKQFYYNEDAGKSLAIMTTIILSLLSLFILLPMLNLINLNVSRIMDRASEIGVRKAFGADKSTILSQFVFENVVLTLIGGVIAMALAGIGIVLLNRSKLLGNSVLSFDGKFFIASLIICLVFGILSGVIPAYKMSKLNIVEALKQNKL